MRRLSAPLALLLAACSGGGEGRIEGRVTWQGRGIGMALVQAYPKPEQDPTTPPVAEAPSGDDGAFRLDLPPGRYWVWAKATVAEGSREARLVGEAPRNPVTVTSGGSAAADVELRDPSGFARSAGPAGTGAAGRVEAGRPGEVTVYAYPGSSLRPVGPGFAAAVSVGADGSFRLDLGPGTYTLAARRRATGKDFGTLAPGDEVATRTIEVQPGAYQDTGVLRMRPLDPAVWGEASRGASPTGTGAEGTVVDGRGKPVAGVRVLAFTDPRMAGKPVALSPPTGADGAFRILLPAGGAYFFGARSRLGGPAEPGERVGSFRGDDGTGVRVVGGETAGAIRIRVEEVW